MRMLNIMKLTVLLLSGILILSCEEEDPFLPNHPPVIVQVGAVEGGVALSGSGPLRCHATDEDGDSLIYFWTAYAGTLTGSGDRVTWTPPEQAARYPFEIRVEDEHGAFAEASFEVQVFGLGNQTWQVFTTENSELPSNYILTLAVNNDDIVWLGSEFSHVTKVENNSWNSWSLASGEIISLAVDSGDRLWIGSDNWPLTRFDGNEFLEYLPGTSARVVAVDGQDDIWVGNYSGISSFDGSDWIHYNPGNSGLPYAHVNSISFDDTDILWAIASDDLSGASSVVQFDGVTWNQYQIERPMNWPGSIAIDQRGNVWVGTQEGLAMYNGSSWTDYPSPHENIGSFGSLAIDTNDHVWCGATPGMLEFDGTNWTIFSSANSQIPEGWVTSLVIDTKGNKWLGSYGFGLAVYNENGIH